MDNTLIDNWNNAVSANDLVYVLGDISWYNDEKTAEIFKQLNGEKILVKGNHDHFKGAVLNLFSECIDRTSVIDQGNYVVMDHFPCMFWDKQFYGSIHLYGHVHNSHQWNMTESWLAEARELQALPMEAINVGCMMPYMDYTPRTLEEIRAGYKEWLNGKI